MLWLEFLAKEFTLTWGAKADLLVIFWKQEQMEKQAFQCLLKWQQYKEMRLESQREKITL